MNFMYIAIFLIAIAFAIVSIYIAKILLRVSSVLSTLGLTLEKVESQLDDSIMNVESMIIETEQTVMDVERKLIATDGLFTLVSNVGDSSLMVSEQIHISTKSSAQAQMQSRLKPFVRIIQFGEFASVLVRSWHRGSKPIR
ncbi:DUF948 domain-containing protein [Sporosarcina sp. FA9]|uniref:DUF948 domain-containing protein n=1 Tax=Sporosarcina sp. FA9 TaxID=3413030 RepID=UPI003F6579AD